MFKINMSTILQQLLPFFFHGKSCIHVQLHVDPFFNHISSLSLNSSNPVKPIDIGKLLVEFQNVNLLFHGCKKNQGFSHHNSVKTAECGKGKWWTYETYAIITSVWIIRDIPPAIPQQPSRVIYTEVCKNRAAQIYNTTWLLWMNISHPNEDDVSSVSLHQN